MPAVPDRYAAYGQRDTYRPSRIERRRKRRLTRSFRLLLVLLGVSLFASGFLLGKATAFVGRSPDGNAAGTQVLVASASSQGEDPSTDREGWKLLLVNAENPLPADFTAPELTQLRNGQAVDQRMYPALQSMVDAARAEGLDPLVCSAYRTQEKQESLYARQVQKWLNQGYSREDAQAQAARWVAPPGTSEHQSGLAVDIVDTAYQLLNEAQEETAVQQWLMAHCAEYGFILRYPMEKSDITGIGYEPWHYRYVGIEAAKEIMEQGLCLEEYLAQ